MMEDPKEPVVEEEVEETEKTDEASEQRKPPLVGGFTFGVDKIGECLVLVFLQRLVRDGC